MKTSKNNKGPKYDFDRLTQHLKINKYNILMVYFVTSESQYNFNKCERQFDKCGLINEDKFQ